MDIAKFSIEKRVISWLFVVVLVFGGLMSFGALGRLEDPEFTIKDAIIFTMYPGASAEEVELEVTDKIETAIQQMPQVKEIKSKSKPGVSEITVTMEDIYDKNSLPQVWDELRRKISDVKGELPPGVTGTIVNDDFGDVYGLFLALSGEGYTYKELYEEAKFLKRELSLVEGVSKVALSGKQQEKVFIEISSAKLSQLGISIDDIKNAIQLQNAISPAGEVRVETGEVRITTTGIFNSVDDIKDLLITKDGNHLVYLKDIANVYSGYEEKPQSIIRVDGKPAITIGLSAQSGVNVVKLGLDVDSKIAELEKLLPAGITIDKIYYQADEVDKSIKGFLVSLVEAVAIVVVVLLVFMGLKSGLLIGSILILSILGTFIFMYMFHIDLQRISLGALIIAMGMLVDNAIVVTEGILVQVQMGKKARDAASGVVKQTAWPLLGATIVAAMAFAGIGLSNDSTGEFCQSLFYVILISLLLSWLLAVTVTPFFCDLILKPSKKKAPVEDPYDNKIFKTYKKLLMLAIQKRKITCLSLIFLLGSAIFGFNFIKQSFFPNSATPIFYVNYWKPQGTEILSTKQDMFEIEKYIQSFKEVKKVTTLVGQGATRFMLVYNTEQPNTSYGQFIIQTHKLEQIPEIERKIMEYINNNYPDNEARSSRIALGPGGDQKLGVRIIGDDAEELRKIAKKIETVMFNSGKTIGIRTNWRQQTKLVNPKFLEKQARNAGLTRPAINQSLEMAFSGLQVGTFREEDELIPITMRLPYNERHNISSLESIQVYSTFAQQYIPIKQLIKSVEPTWEDSIINRKDRRRYILISADQKPGLNANAVFQELRPQIEKIELPQGYYLEWAGEYEDSQDAQEALFSNIKPSFGAMILIVILLFNAIRQPLIIWLCVPLAIIGVTAGLLIFNGSFGFMALIGFLSLTGLLIKNAIVLIDQIDLEIREGKEKLRAIVESSVSRVRPVAMGAITTILGMIPLLGDAFFVDMAITIMAGLAFATVLTLFVVPVLYTIFFKVKPREKL